MRSYRLLQSVYLTVCLVTVVTVSLTVYSTIGSADQTHNHTLYAKPSGKFNFAVDRAIQSKLEDDTQPWKVDLTLGSPLQSEKPNCSLLFDGDSNEIKRVRTVKWTIPKDNDLYQQLDCEKIRELFKTSNYYISDKERNVPLAFALSVYNAPYQIVRFLKVIYRPHNIYCLHYDKKSRQPFKNLMITLAKCLPNVIVPRKIADVVWGWHTIVDAQLNCMEDLYEKRNEIPWKYVLTLCGKEVPLRTNREMVESLEKLNGTSAVNARPQYHNREDKFWQYKYILHPNSSITKSKQKLAPLPFGLEISKSSSYYALSDLFVNYLLHNNVAVGFRKYMEDTFIPDEHFVATLFNTTGVPGGARKEYNNLIPYVINAIWHQHHPKDWENHCSGWTVHDICLISSGDLHRIDYIADQTNGTVIFFHNKFFIEKDRVVMDCAEQELVRRNLEEYPRDKYV